MTFITHRSTLALTLPSVITLLFIGSTTPLPAAPAFTDVTADSLDGYASETWGISIGDMDGDFWPDVFVGNHRNRPSIYKNNGDGTFSNSILQVDTSRAWLSNRFADHHGASWADFDGDGDDDLFAGTNGCCYSELMVSENGVFSNEATTRIGQKTNSGYAAWFDIDQDGLSDLIQARGSHEYYLQNQSGNFGPKTPVSSCGGDWLLLSDLTGDHKPEYICFNEGTFPRRVFDLSSGSFNDITANFPTVPNVVDSTAADLNNDLEPDLIFVRGATLANQALQVGPQRIEAALDSSPNQGSAGFKFNASGNVTFTIHTRHSSLAVNAGNQSSSINRRGSVTLNPSDTSLHGAPNASGLSVAVGYDPATNEWTFVQSDSGGWFYIYVEVQSSSAVSNVQSFGLREVDGPTRPRVLLKEASSYVNRTFETGMAIDIECNAVASADFDNDMDQDLYFVCSRGAENINNRLFENQGDGTFVEVSGAGGASGVTGSSVLDGAGNGENVGVADFNNDGYLDLFITNGINSQPLRSAGGPHQVMMNNADNGNNWIELELRGTNSNADGIGASVVATAGGVSQLREQSGVYHRWSQSDNRLHFGLANNATVDLLVRWPNGAEESFSNVSANQLYLVTEGTGMSVVTPTPPLGFDAPQPGDECGSPLYYPGLDKALFVYRDCASDLWKVRVTGGGSETGLRFKGEFLSDVNLSDVNGFNLEGSDSIDNSSSTGIDFSLDVIRGGEDGFEFRSINATQLCLSLNSPNDMTVLVGPRHLPVQLPFDLLTMGPCNGSSNGLSIGDAVVEEGSGTATVTVTLDPPASTAVSVNAQPFADSATPGSDYYGFFMPLNFAVGESSKSFEVSIIDDLVPESDEQFSIRLTGANGADIADGEASITINDNDQSGIGCGAPMYSPGQDAALHIWKDCNGNWHMVSSAGGNSSGVRYEGSLTSSLGFASVLATSQEGNDVADNSSPWTINFVQRVANSGTDSIEFQSNTGSELCLTSAVGAPGNLPILLGAAKTPITPPVNLVTLGSCSAQNGNIPPQLANVTNQSSALNVALTLTLSASDGNGDTISYSATGLPPGLSLDSTNGEISGTPTNSGTYTVDVTVTDPAGASDNASFDWNINGVNTTFSRRINNNNDDAEERIASGSMYLTSTDLELIKDGSLDQLVGMRFTNITVPQGVTVTNAYIEFTADEVNSGITSVVFRAEASANGNTFTSSDNNISSRPLTSASTSWNNIPPWVVNDLHQSPDLSPIVQELVDQANWVAGNAMVFIVSGSGERTAESHNGEPGSAPRLVIEYIQ